jgi:hypothetical protein
VKCDEAKPECERCTSTSRKCDGYVTPKPKKDAPKLRANVNELALGRAINWEQGDSSERRAIDYFRCHTAPGVASYFDTDFVGLFFRSWSFLEDRANDSFHRQWSRLVLAVSQSEPAVRHALVAVGTLNERRDVYLRDVTFSKSIVIDYQLETGSTFHCQQEQHNDPFAISQYNKSIAHLANAMNSPSSNSIDTALLVCILFVCVECLRGDYAPALKHFQGGMSIALAAAGKGGPNCRATQPTGLREKLMPFFNRLELLCQLYGQRPEYIYGLSPSQALPDAFHSIVEARDSIVHLMNISIRLIHSTKFRRYKSQITFDDIVQHNDVVSCLSTWRTTLDCFLATAPPSSHLTEAATILEIQRIATLTWLNRALVPEESAADADIPLYEQAVRLAESLQISDHNQIKSTTTKSTLPASTFLFDMEIVSPLYLVAIKCRDPSIRRRAIAVLRHTVRREGLWDSVKAAAIAERVMQIEEKGLPILDGSVLPAEGARVANCHIDSGPGLNPSGHKVTFFTMPAGIRGNWHTWDEWVELRC